MTYPQTTFQPRTLSNQALASNYVVPFLNNTKFAVADNTEVRPLNYGEGTYNSSTYGGETQQTGFLSKTGTSIIFVVTVSAVLLFSTLIIIILRRPSRKDHTAN